MRRALGVALVAALAGCPAEVRLPSTEGGAGGAGSQFGGEGGEAGAGGGAPLDCSSFAGPCRDVALVAGACVVTPLADGTPCDDQLSCTLLDHCQAGACVAGTPAECAASDLCHVVQCNEQTDQCEVVPGNDGALCDDGDLCTVETTCDAGECNGGLPVECFTGDSCRAPICEPALGCSSVPVNVGSVCGEPGPCNERRCSPQGTCETYFTNEGLPCSDGLSCTGADHCLNGFCAGQLLPEGTPCDPGVSCLAGGTCSGYDCYASGDSCGDTTEVCVDRYCAPYLDGCVGAPLEGMPCEHPSVCLGPAACQVGRCGSVGAVAENDGAPCDAAGVCMTSGACAAGLCVGAPVTSCASGDGCCPVGCSEGDDSDCAVRVYMASTLGVPGFFAYDPESASWTTLPEPPVPIRSRLVVGAGLVHAIGQDRRLLSYDPAASSWAIGRPLPSDTAFAGDPPGGMFLAYFGGDLWFSHEATGTLLYRAVGAEWVTFYAYTSIGPAGGVDPATGVFLFRGLDFAYVHAFDPASGAAYLWGWQDNTLVQPSSRFGSIVDGAYYLVTEPAHSLLQITVASQGSGTDLALVPADPNPSSDADPEAGLLYLGPSDGAGAFQALDTTALALIDLPSPPAIPDGYLSSLAVLRAPSEP